MQREKSPDTDKEHDASVLIKQYLNIANDALMKQKDDLALKGIVVLLERIFSRENITLEVVDETGESMGYFTTRFTNGQFAPVRPGIYDPETQFIVKRSYLQQVVDNAEEYLNHPIKLDWDWLTGQIKPTEGE